MRSGYVALIGRTNVGKSTFLNAVLGRKISIVSSRPQTTRRQILGIKTSPRGQIVFFDSPGIHVPHHELNRKMMKHVHDSFSAANLILYFKTVEDRRRDSFVLDLMGGVDTPVFLILNKIDRFNRNRALEAIQFHKDDYTYREIVPISALRGDNLQHLEDMIFGYLPAMPALYPGDTTTLQSEKYYLSEIIREKLLQQVRDEIPFTTHVYIEEYRSEEQIQYLKAVIVVEQNSQKKIVIGQGGSMVKKIGTLARRDLEDYFSKKVFLELQVKVMPRWRDSHPILNELINR